MYRGCGGLLVLLAAAGSLPAQRVITTYAGTDTIPIAGGIPAVNAAIGVNAVNADRFGNFYVCDEFQNVVLKVDSQGGIVVLAGNGIQTFSGDGGLAVNASVNEPQGVAVDASGNIFISDSFNHRIRKITTDGIITTVAGNGQPGFSGDGGPAVAASMNRPYRIALDSAGNLYIVDSLNNRIRKVDTDGTITTVAGTGAVGFSGDGGPAAGARLGNPVGIAIGSDNTLYIADKDNNRIRKVDAQGIITTIAGTGEAGFSGDGGPARNAAFYWPYGLSFDSTGNLFVVDYVNNRIRRIDTQGIVTTVAGNGQRGFSGDGGPATSAPLEFPFSADVDSSDRLLISDTFNNRIRRVSQGIISTAAGTGRLQNPGDNGPATSAQFNRPYGVAIDAAGNMFVADTYQYLIRKIAVNGVITTIAGNGRLGYSGDGGAALNAALNAPESVAVDATGNVYIADTFNHRIRRVTPQGTITTIAGNEFAFFAGDGGPANRASLNFPSGITLDANNNLFIADTSNNRIRKVTPQGVISTVAGNGQAGYSGDGGSALSAALNGPQEVAVDTAGNLFIADTNNNRIRKVTPQGLISSIAGNGQFGYSGDGGAALQASLAAPSGISLDTAGNILIADSLNDRIRVVDTSLRIFTFAGNGKRGFSGDGDVATLASFGAPEGVWVAASGDVFIADTRNKRIRRVLVQLPPFDISRTTLQFSGSSDGAPTTEQGIGVSASIVGVPYTAAVTTPNVSWIRLTGAQGATPGRVGVVADPTGLAPGTYQATISVNAPNAQPRVRVVSVTFTVGEPDPAKLSISPGSLSFSLSDSTAPQTQNITVSNAGGGSLDFIASAGILSGDQPWLSLSGDSGSVRPGAAASLAVTVNPAGLAPGNYNGVVTIASPTTGESVDVAITFALTLAQKKIVLSQTGLTFTAVAGGGDNAPLSFALANDGSGVLNWSVSARTLSGGDWLSVTPDSGSSDAAGVLPGVDVRVDPSQLAPGLYTGQVRVDAPSADNSPQFVSVYVNVLPAGSNPGPILQPSGLRFTGVAGGSNPGSQTVLVYNSTASPVSFTSSRTFIDGKDWFVHVPSGGTVIKGQPARILVQPSIAGLSPGVRRGALNVQFSDGSVRAIDILLVLTSGGASPQSLKDDRHSLDGCSPSALLPVFTSLGQDFSVPAGWPVAVQARVLDDCGAPFTSGTVTATFSNGDPAIVLNSLKDGRYNGTWQTRSSRPGITITLNAARPGTPLKGTSTVTGGLSSAPVPPLIRAGGIVSAASLSDRIPPAPGSMISIFGSSLAVGSEQASSTPLPTQLASTIVLLAGQPLPLLSAGDGRVDALVPWGIPVNAKHQLVIQRGTSLTVPEAVTLIPAQPAIFSVNNSGGGQGKIFRLLDDGTQVLADPSAPAHADEVLVIQAGGLGPVDPLVDIAAPAPDPPPVTVNAVAVSIGGIDAPVQFSGMLPGSPGVYQVRATVPGGVTAGDAVSVVLKVAGQVSSPVTMSVQ